MAVRQTRFCAELPNPAPPNLGKVWQTANVMTERTDAKLRASTPQNHEKNAAAPTSIGARKSPHLGSPSA